MQYCSDVASAAHVELLRYAKPGELDGLASKSFAAMQHVFHFLRPTHYDKEFWVPVSHLSLLSYLPQVWWSTS